MQTEHNPFYVTGGTLETSAASYVVRAADIELLERLRHGEFCYVLDTRQMGKSSLMVRTAEKLRTEGVGVALIDLTSVGHNLSPEQWYFGMLGRLGEQVGQEEALFDFWREHRAFGPMQRWIEAVRQILLPNLPQQARQERDPAAPSLVIFVDEIDAVRSLPFSSDEFFAGIRECYNRRTTDPLFRRLTFVLLGVAAPTDLIREARMSPFNIGRRILLADFSPTEAEPLTQGLGPIENGQTARPLALALLRRVFYWTGGHPYLTQRLCLGIADHPEIQEVAGVDRLCKALFLERTAREANDNLIFVRTRLLQSGTDISALLDLYARIRSGRRVRDDESDPLYSALRLSGVVRSEGGRLHVRNRIYDTIFDRDWITAHLPGAELRRQQAAFRRGQLRFLGQAAGVVILLAVLAGIAGNSALRARRAEREATHQGKIASDLLSRNQVGEGMRLLEDNDPGAALLPLTEALRIDSANPRRAAMHRDRIARALQEAPQLEQMWFSAGPITWAEFSPDGRQIVIASESGEVSVWNAESGAAVAGPWRHPGPVTRAAFSPDGTRVATCCQDRSVRVWRTTEGQPEQILKLPDAPVCAVWSPDGNRLATACFEHVMVWEIRSQDRGGKRLADDVSQNARPAALAYSPDGTRLACVFSNYSAGLLEGTTLKAISKLGSSKQERCYIGRTVCFSPSGDTVLVSGSFGNHSQILGACLFDGHTGKRLRAFPQTGYGVAARFSDDGARIVSASEDESVRVWNAADGRPVSPSLSHRANVVSAVFSPTGTRLVTASGDTAQVWDAQPTGNRIGPPLKHAGRIVAATFDRSGERILTAGRDHTARLWKLPSPQPPYRPLQRIAPLVRQEVLLGGSRVFSLTGASNPGQNHNRLFAQIADAATGRILFPATPGEEEAALCDGYTLSTDGRRIVLYGPRGVQVRDAADAHAVTPLLQGSYADLSPDGRKLLVLENGGMRLLDLETRKEIALPGAALVGGAYAWYRPFRPDSTRVVIKSPAGMLHIADASTGRIVGAILPQSSPVQMLRWSPDGRFLFTWSGPPRVEVWDGQSGRQVADVPYVPMKIPFPIAGMEEGWEFSPDGRHAVTASVSLSSQQHPLVLWDLGTGTPVRSAEAPLPVATRPTFSPDGSRMATNGVEPRLWDPKNGVPLTPILEHDGSVNSIAFSPDGRLVVTAGADSTARVWNAATGSAETQPLRHFRAVTTAAFSPDGHRIVTGDADGSLRIWDAATGEPLTRWLRQSGPLLQTRFTPNGRHLVATSPAETRLWDLPREDRSVEVLSALARLLSGQRTDPQIGVTSAEPDLLRSSWAKLLHP